MDVVWAVAAESDIDPCFLPPLGDAIDPDALDSLFKDNSARTDPDQNGPSVTFSYAGHRVTVGSGEMTIQPAD
jgi:hypothetical protein